MWKDLGLDLEAHDVLLGVVGPLYEQAPQSSFETGGLAGMEASGSEIWGNVFPGVG